MKELGELCSHVKRLMGEKYNSLTGCGREHEKTSELKCTIIPLKNKNKRIKSRQGEAAEEYEVKKNSIRNENVLG